MGCFVRHDRSSVSKYVLHAVHRTAVTYISPDDYIISVPVTKSRRRGLVLSSNKSYLAFRYRLLLAPLSKAPFTNSVNRPYQYLAHTYWTPALQVRPIKQAQMSQDTVSALFSRERCHVPWLYLQQHAPSSNENGTHHMQFVTVIKALPQVWPYCCTYRPGIPS